MVDKKGVTVYKPRICFRECNSQGTIRLQHPQRGSLCHCMQIKADIDVVNLRANKWRMSSTARATKIKRNELEVFNRASATITKEANALFGLMMECMEIADSYGANINGALKAEELVQWVDATAITLQNIHTAYHAFFEAGQPFIALVD